MKKITTALIAFTSLNVSAFGLGDNSEQMNTLLTVINNKGLSCDEITSIVPGFTDVTVTCDGNITYAVKEKDGDYTVTVTQ